MINYGSLALGVSMFLRLARMMMALRCWVGLAFLLIVVMPRVFFVGKIRNNFHLLSLVTKVKHVSLLVNITLAGGAPLSKYGNLFDCFCFR